ncbi:MAG TPA: hypothetical protein VKV32_15640 [Stellaceae bacterium]|nr:hypothetical protein [Stellaceae bacterium]
MALVATIAPPFSRQRIAFVATALALSGCAGAPHVPDMPFTTKDVCAAAAVPDGWIRTNDWRAKGCDEQASPRDNNWMTITELSNVRIGRSLTACAGAVPQGWEVTARYWDKGRCGNPPTASEKNVMLIKRVE